MIKTLIVFLCVLLVACSTPPTVTQVNTKVIAPDDSLIIDCNITAPPDKKEYVAATMKIREQSLANYSSSLMNDLIICNQRIAGIREWKVNTIKAIADVDKK